MLRPPKKHSCVYELRSSAVFIHLSIDHPNFPIGMFAQINIECCYSAIHLAYIIDLDSTFRLRCTNISIRSPPASSSFRAFIREIYALFFALPSITSNQTEHEENEITLFSIKLVFELPWLTTLIYRMQITCCTYSVFGIHLSRQSHAMRYRVFFPLGMPCL